MPASIEQLELLKSKIDDRINGINSRRLYYRRQAFYAFIGTAILSALATVLLGLQSQSRYIETIRISCLIITSIITIINTYNAFFNHKELWIANNNALNKFYELKFNIEYFEKESQPWDMQSLLIFKQTYQEILNDLNQIWSKTRTETHK